MAAGFDASAAKAARAVSRRRTESRQLDSEPRDGSGYRILGRSPDAQLTRRDLLALGVGAAAALAWPLRGRAALPADVTGLLEKSGFVYVSPLKKDGAESRCHGEVWYGWLDGRVVLITGKSTWKARALERGLARARIWVGDHGRVGRMLGSNEAFRQAPSFEASAARSQDAALLDRLMAAYRAKYPDEIGQWEPRMRAGFANGERVLITYAPA
jgi:hypothetical protein